MKVREAEVAWAGGIFEGEGCFSLHQGRRARAQVAMADRDVIERFHWAVGCGSVRHINLRNRPPHHYQDQWHWNTNSREEFEWIMRLLWPWLGARRRKRADEILAELRRTDYWAFTCAHCGKAEMIATRSTNSNKTYCSTRCKQAAYHERHPGKRAAYMRQWHARRKAQKA